MKWIRTIAVGLAAAVAAITLSFSLVAADDCNQPAPDDFRSDVAWDGTGLHHQSQDVQNLFSRVWGIDDDLHVRTWAWQHNCRTRPRDETAGPTDESPIVDGDSSSESAGGRPDAHGSGNSVMVARSRCAEPRPRLTWREFIEGTWYYCDERTGEWDKRRRWLPGIDYATDNQLVAPGVGNCQAGYTHYDPIREICIHYPNGPAV